MTKHPILFLDLDDVVCLNNPYGGYDVMVAMQGFKPQAVSELRQTHDALWNTLFDPSAASHLRRIDKDFHPVYVLSTSWTRFMDQDTISDALKMAGLGFVAANLHPDWETIKTGSDRRGADIQTWIDTHPECKNYWVILDDELSGTGIDQDDQFVVLCQKGVGLTDLKYAQLRMALAQRVAKHEPR